MQTRPYSLAGLRIATWENQRAEEITQLIRDAAGDAQNSPASCQVNKHAEAVDFANRILTGQIDVVIFITAASVRDLIARVERHIDRQRFLDSLSDVVTICRRPAAAAALAELGIQCTRSTGTPHGWREILSLVDGGMPVANQVVGMQEYGEASTCLIAGLEARGGTVQRLQLQSCELPPDLSDVTKQLQAVIAGQRDVVLFTSAHQAQCVLLAAERMHSKEALTASLARGVVSSLNAETTELLNWRGIPVDVQGVDDQLESLLAEIANQAPALLASKRQSKQPPHRKSTQAKAAPAASATHVTLPPENAMTTDLQNSLFMRAARCEPTERTPIWIMRQAGRYLPEYRAIRSKVTFLELCKNPQLCAEVMITTVNRLQVDAAIIFADLLPILEPMGFNLEFAQGEGPVIHNPVRTAADLARVRELEDVSALHFVMETVALTRAGLPPSIPVLGFAGAPFTLASYAIEGGSSRNYAHTKELMYRDQGAWDALMSLLSRAVVRYLNAQIDAGAQCVQIFDSWVGCLGTADYRRYVLPHMHAILAAIQPGVPVINFATGNPALLPLLREAGGSVIGIDWRIDLDAAWDIVGHDKAVQGNMDPLVLLADEATVRQRATEVLKQAAGRPGHIFNLGHGVLPQTPVENVLALIDTVKSYRLL
ncbi:MAG: uroporphyrinogen decarboxylase [Planctomycetota bacterium]|nr:uroporphyrinogen decarboxylase [Planctomycetota bacterium]